MSCWLDVRPCEVYIPEKPMADSHRLLRHFYQPVVTTTHSVMDSIRACLDTSMVSRLSKMPERNNDPQLFTSTRQRPSQIVSILASVNTCKSEMKNIYPRNVNIIFSFNANLNLDVHEQCPSVMSLYDHSQLLQIPEAVQRYGRASARFQVCISNQIWLGWTTPMYHRLRTTLFRYAPL